MNSGSVCRHLKIVGRIAFSTIISGYQPQPDKVATHPLDPVTSAPTSGATERVSRQSSARGKEHSRRNMETFAEPFDVVEVQSALAGENQRYRALATKLRCDVSLRQSVPLQ